MLFNLGYLVICHPTPLRSHAFVAMQPIMLEMGSVGQGKLACVIRFQMKHLERSYSTLLLFNLGYLVICHPIPLRSHAFVAMQSIMLEMGSVGQGKLACAIRA